MLLLCYIIEKSTYISCPCLMLVFVSYFDIFEGDDKVKRNFIYVLFLLLLCSACHKKQMLSPLLPACTLDLDLLKADTALRDIIERVDMLPLEMTDASVMFGVDKMVLKNNLIYLGDFRSGKVVIYDTKGKIKSVISRKGNGPEEYLEMKSFAVDNHYVYVIDNYRHKLNCYDCETGEFRDSRSLPFVAWDVEILPDGNLIFVYIPFKEGNGPDMKQAYSKIFITDTLLTIKRRMFDYEPGDYEFIGKRTYFTLSEQGIVFSSMASDDFYIWETTDSVARMQINFKNKVPYSRIDLEEILKGGYNYLVNTPLLCKHYVIFVSPEGRTVLDYVYDLKSQILFTNDIVNTYRGLLTPLAVYGDKLISYLDDYGYYQELVQSGFEKASDVVEKHLKKDNPILIIYTLK